MASTPDNLYVTFVEVDHDLLKIWGQGNRIGATYIERQLLQLLPEFERTLSPNPTQIQKGMFCFAKYTDNSYYRARVISRVQGDSVGVLFIDYGNKDIIKLSNIRIQDGSEGDVLAKMSEQAEDYYLAGVAAPPGGWTKEIISKIRSDICYEEFLYQIVTAVGDQKILEIQFHNEDFSNYLVKKQLASLLSLPVQRQMILSYNLGSSDVKLESTVSDISGITFSSSIPPPNMKSSFRSPNAANGGIMQLKYEKTNNAPNLSLPPPSVDFSSPRHINSTYQQMNSSIPKNPYFPNVSHLHTQMPVNASLLQPINPVLNPLLSHNSLHVIKENSDLFNSNNNIIQILAQQVKQYIAEDNAKLESRVEDSPHHYVNSVLEVGNTYNVLISYISDGPWSFSIQLLSSETELQKLMDELSSTELIPIKPPIILGHPCIASSALYGNLCRGVVVSISHSAVKVYFVDFGNTEDLPSSSIYKLPPKFFKIRVLSQKFSLSGLQKVAYSDDIKKFFKEVVQDELLMLRVISLDDDNLPTCELYLKDKNIKRILNEKIRELRNSTVECFPKVGDTENVVVTWVISPQKFFVQLRKRDADLKALKKELAEVDTKGQRLTHQQLRVGFKCVSRYESDGQWYRAVITSVDSEVGEQNAITVFYVDYGNTETVNISFLRTIDSSGLINQMSNQAIQCTLKGFENKPFDEALANKLELLILEKELQMSIVSSEKEFLSVQLFKDGQDVSTLLASAPSKVELLESYSQSRDTAWSFPKSAESNFGGKFEKEKQFPEKSESCEKKDSGNFRCDKSRFESKENSRNDKTSENEWKEQKSNNQESWQLHCLKQNKGNNDWNNANLKSGGNRGLKLDKGRDDRIGSVKFEKSRGFKQDRGRDDWNIRQNSNNFGNKKKLEENRGGRERFDEKKFHAREGKQFNGSKDLDSLKKGDWNKNIDRSHSTFFENDKPKNLRKSIRKEDVVPPGSKFKERIVHLGSCEKGIVTYYFSPHEFYVQLLDQEEEFKKMMKDIQTYYSDKYSVKDPVQVGDVVIAQFSFDKVLYRAEVIKPSPVTVRYVDYGNQEPVSSKAIWLVHKRFLNLPKQVIKCRLSDIQPVGSDWPPPGNAVDKFFELAEYKCTFLKLEGDMYEISMENARNGKNVATEIIAAGLGRPVTPNLGIPEIDYSLLPNQTLRLYVSYVESSSKFYVIINPKGLEVIENELKTLSANKKNLIPLSSDLINPGTPCLLINDEISWHRGSIINTVGNKISIWVIDRGYNVEIRPDKVMNIPDYLKVFQPQAVQCSLYGVSGIKSEEEFKKEIEFKHHLVSIKAAADKSLSVILYNEDGLKYDFHKCGDFPHSIEPISQLPIISQKLQIIISYIKTPKEIYIQRLVDGDELGSFSQSVSKFYSEEKEGFDIEDIEGQLVAAKSVVYETWCRGRLISVKAEGLEVFYIDYGNTEILPRENVKKLDASFRSLNAFCKKLALDVEFSVNKTQEINNRFLELCQGKELLAYFKRDEDILVSEITFNGKRVTHFLECEKLVTMKEEDKFAGIVSNEKAHKETQEVYEIYEKKLGINSSRVFVRHIDSPKQFWVQKESTVNDLHELQDKLQKSCEIVPVKKNISVNDLVAILFCDRWYRAKVVNVGGNNISARFIDYGNTVTVDLTSNTIKQLTDEFISVPAFATPFALKGTWNENSTTKFEEIILQDEDPVSIVVLDESDPTIVDLFQNGQSITDMLLEEGDECEEEEEENLELVYITHSNSPNDFYIRRKSCTDILNKLTERLLNASEFNSPTTVEENKIYAAKFQDEGAWYRAKINKKQGDETEVFFIDYGYTSNTTNIKCLPNDITDIPNLAENCCLLYGRNSDFWSETACEKFEEYADGRALKMKVVVSRVKKSVVELFHEDKNITHELEVLCKNDERSEVYVTYALSPTDFYIQFVDDEYYKLIAETLENCNESEELEDALPGTLCQACFTDDGCWYRAKILKNLSEGCEVFFIDFGNTSLATDIRKLPSELEKIPPRALRCSLNLPETNIEESVKEEFINLTTKGESIFRIRLMVPGDINIVSLKLDGRILEETLNLNVIPKDNDLAPNNENISNSNECETDDGKNSKKNLISEDFMMSNLANDIRRGESVGNETDEEKRVKIAISGVDGFKSDDEKEIEGNISSGFINATDSELMEEVRENYEGVNASEVSTDDSRDHVLENVEEISERTKTVEKHSKESNEPPEQEANIITSQDAISSHNTVNTVNNLGKLSETTENKEVKFVNSHRKCSRNKVHKIVPGSISRGEKEIFNSFTPSYQKLKFSEKIVPGSISRGVSLESIANEYEPLEESPERKTSQSAPNTPKFTRRSDTSNYIKIHPNDRLVPGCISTGVSLHSSPAVEKIPRTDKIIPGAVNGSVKDF